jgi:hypothetical protein
MTLSRAVLAVALVGLVTPAVAGKAEQRLLERVMAYASAPELVLTPPSSVPSPPMGSFVVPYAAPGGGDPDPRRVGTYSAAPSSCSESLQFQTVPATESRQELWATETGIGISIGLPMVEIGGSWGRKSMAGIEYHITEKVILDGGLGELEECCLRTPERCTGEYISESWKGTARIHRMVSSKSGLKPIIKQLEQVGSVDFTNSRGFSMSSEWSEPQYFAYRTVPFQIPRCDSYMNSLEERDGMVLFSGVSGRSESEQDARRDARDDARRQVAEYLGQTFSIQGDVALSNAESLISGVKDSLTCLDPVMESASGPRYLARVRMYASSDDLQAGRTGVRSTLGDGPAPVGSLEGSGSDRIEPAPEMRRAPTPRR